MTLVENADYFVRVVQLPFPVRAMTAANPDGTFTVYLNSRNTYGQTLKAIDHEYEHMESDDFHSGLPIEEIEGL